MKVLYIDCFSGISGDMMVGALLDAGASFDKIQTELKKLDVSGYRLEWERVVKEGISATKFNVILEENHAHHHHHEHEHHHHGHSHHHHSHYADIVRIIEQSDLDENVKRRSKEIFAPIAKAEAKIHNMPVEDVHFHEVGAVDSIVDIIATAIALEDLQIDKIITSPVPLGSGQIRISHGIYPVPAPATLEMMKGIPIASSDLPYELTTPTGAGIVVSQSDSFGQMPSMNLQAIGYGAGTRNIPGRPNVLRVMIGESLEAPTTETIHVLECQLDDMAGEQFGYVLDQLFAKGALDVYYTPVYMKKNRPGTLITVLAPMEREQVLTNVLLTETTTLGVRKSTWTRSMLERKSSIVETNFGPIRVKQAIRKGRVLRETPEYEDVRATAEKHDVPFLEVYQAVMRNVK